MTAVLVLVGNSAASIPESDKRCRVDGLPETFSLIGAPIRLSMRSGGENPYVVRNETAAAAHHFSIEQLKPPRRSACIAKPHPAAIEPRTKTCL
jgi:hypothetical protein